MGFGCYEKKEKTQKNQKNDYKNMNYESNIPSFRISDQLSKSICQITTKKVKASGFLCNIKCPVLITNNSVLNQNQIISGEEINIYFMRENGIKICKKIKIDENRTTYTIGKINDEEINTTIIELKPDKDELNYQYFLEIDEDLMTEKIKNIYEKKNILFAYYKDGEKLTISNGYIYEIQKNNESYTLMYTSNTDKGFNGNPIILYDNKVIGLHKEHFKIEKNNKASLLQYPIKKYIEKFNYKKIYGINKSITNEKKEIKEENDKNNNLNDNKNYLNGDCFNNKANSNIKQRSDSFNHNFITEEKVNDKITMIYIIEKRNDGINILGKDFVENNRNNCKMIINKKEYDINNYIKYDEYYINKSDNFLTIILTGINKINDASYTFYECSSLRSLPDISEWNTKNVKNIGCMFYGCISLHILPDISKWNIENVKNMTCMFYGCSSLQSLPDISKWNTKNITNMSGMFCECSSLQSLPDISYWNTENVKYIHSMFCECSSLQFLPDISKWDLRNVEDMGCMFDRCSSLKSLPDISKWDTKNVKNMHSIFYGCSSLRFLPDISKWDTKNVEDMGCVFYGCSSLQLLPDISKWDVQNVTNMIGMFCECSSLQFLPDISKWNVRNPTNINGLFLGCSSLKSLPDIKWNNKNTTNMNSMF